MVNLARLANLLKGLYNLSLLCSLTQIDLETRQLSDVCG